MTSAPDNPAVSCNVRPGQRYAHYKKGTIYLVLAVAIHTETKETMVVYRSWRKPHTPTYVRPLSVFTSLAMQGAMAVQRFTLVG